MHLLVRDGGVRSHCEETEDVARKAGRQQESAQEGMSKRWGVGICVIPQPRDVDALMKRVPRGRLTTINQLRAAVAKQYGGTIGCPITTGIFAWIAAHAAAEAQAAGLKRVTPYWRTLKTGGEINPKYPGGVLEQCRLLKAEGHRVERRGKRHLVADYEQRVVTPRG